jgi:hypothetical protein
MKRAGRNNTQEWGDREFEEELSSKMLWSSAAKMFVYDYEALYELAADPRTPEVKAARLKDLLNEWEKLNERVRRC